MQEVAVLTTIFFVGAINSNNVTADRAIPAQFLMVNGKPVVDPDPGNTSKWNIYDSNGNIIPNANPNNYLIIPANYSISGASSFASQVAAALNQTSDPTQDFSAAMGIMEGAFNENDPQDIQRGTEWGIPSGLEVPAFQDAASFNLGFITEQSGLSLLTADAGGGAENEVNSLWEDFKGFIGLQNKTINTHEALRWIGAWRRHAG